MATLLILLTITEFIISACNNMLLFNKNTHHYICAVLPLSVYKRIFFLPRSQDAYVCAVNSTHNSWEAPNTIKWLGQFSQLFAKIN